MLINSQALVDNRVEFCLLKWLGDVVNRTQSYSLDYFFGVIHAREHYYLDIRLELAQALERFQTINTRHEKVEQHEIRLQAFLDFLQRLLTCGSSLYLVVVNLEQRPNVTLHSGFVIHQQNLRFVAHLSFPLEFCGRIQRNNERELASSAKLTFYPDFACHAQSQATRDCQA